MSPEKDVFQYLNYKTYVKDWMKSQPKQGRGQRSTLAERMRSPVSHISQVLNGGSNLSLEQAEEVNDYFQHDNMESDYFLLLVQLERAGSKKLKHRIESQIKQLQEKRIHLTDRLAVKKSIPVECQAQFYSQWYYVAVHILLTIEAYQTKEAISKHLRLSINRVSEILDFLVEISMAQKSGNRYMVGTSRIHLSSDSPMITKHHFNWRIQAMRSLESERSGHDLHYSSVVSLSKEDVSRIKTLLVNEIEKFNKIVKDSKEEELFSLCVDFFKV